MWGEEETREAKEKRAGRDSRGIRSGGYHNWGRRSGIELSGGLLCAMSPGINIDSMAPREQNEPNTIHYFLFNSFVNCRCKFSMNYFLFLMLTVVSLALSPSAACLRSTVEAVGSMDGCEHSHPAKQCCMPKAQFVRFQVSLKRTGWTYQILIISTDIFFSLRIVQTTSCSS